MAVPVIGVVASAVALHEPLGIGNDGKAVYLRDLWPSQEEVRAAIEASVSPEMFADNYAVVFNGDEHWQGLPVPSGHDYTWDDTSTYIHEPPFFKDLSPEPAPLTDIQGARVLAVLGDSITTDHISPAGNIKKDSPAGRYLQARGVQRALYARPIHQHPQRCGGQGHWTSAPEPDQRDQEPGSDQETSGESCMAHKVD